MIRLSRKVGENMANKKKINKSILKRVIIEFCKDSFSSIIQLIKMVILAIALLILVLGLVYLLGSIPFWIFGEKLSALFLVAFFMAEIFIVVLIITAIEDIYNRYKKLSEDSDTAQFEKQEDHDGKYKNHK